MSPDVFRDYNAFLREVRAQEQERTQLSPSGALRSVDARPTPVPPTPSLDDDDTEGRADG